MTDNFPHVVRVFDGKSWNWVGDYATVRVAKMVAKNKSLPKDHSADVESHGTRVALFREGVEQ